MKKIIALLVLAVLISGCGSVGNALDSRAGGLWDFRSPGTAGTTTASEVNP
jgi:hypothetical protein